MTTTIDFEGRIALGRDVQEQLGVRPGDTVTLENRGEEWILKAVPKTGLRREGNVLVHGGATPPDFDIVEFIDRLRDERNADLRRGDSE